ncbi:UDP-2,4-diacetamido-2,4,6-trideoxy-beta-L-altropyranose hydrolase [Frischella perrara]|uniref:UDP-2,4-diacetamido-2,4, 6-trideoxy-beta-L-altropyranose hydrolase n=1 Tax=Frischella perrara TaxID=1267021 RepID=UPI0023F56F60|nr:UDP-2,4-diacetamido-2,4,6-trideoxy-beta-L-altropyranose hydrolase [Frischella perrara]MCT6874747.1 UDP-2,4-diacetamido-2,4,6-trideoxy-beta-L-altropyranose hydrolase [Frischella perrara]
MNIVFRVDAAQHIGSGHVMRCLTLADELSQHGVNCIFISREFEGNLFSLIKEKGYLLYSLSSPITSLYQNPNQLVPHEHWLGVNYEVDAKQTIDILNMISIKIDWLIVDHYAIDSRWEEIVKPYVQKIMIIDDLADRQHDCDLLLDQTYQRNKTAYDNNKVKSQHYLLGSKYCLLRNEFLENRNKTLQYFDHEYIDDTSKRILISMGGVDKDNITGKILDSLSDINLLPDDELHIIMGKNAKWLTNIKNTVMNFKCKTYVYHDIRNVAEIMSRCNLAIGAGGTTTWERCSLGLPSIIISIAENQNLIIEELVKCGASWFAGRATSLNKSTLESIIKHAIFDKFSLYSLSKICRDICDGYGTKRVVNIMLSNEFNFDFITEDDIPILYQWRNHEHTRKMSFNSSPIIYQDHVNWMKNKLKDESFVFLKIINFQQESIGCIRLFLNNDESEISIYLDPDKLGEGLGSRILCQFTPWVKENLPQIKYIKARIKSENKASIKVFERSGYKMISSDYILNL